MAWYAELQRRHWYCINGFSMIRWYKKFLYDNWWNSLTEEERIRVQERRKLKSEEYDRQLRNSIARIGMMASIVAGLGTPYTDYDELAFRK